MALTTNRTFYDMTDEERKLLIESRRFHSVTFDSRNSWTDWHLIPMTRPVINPPPVKTQMIDIPGGYGSLDLTTALTNTVLYGQRTGSIEFAVVNDIYGEVIMTPRHWADRYSEIQNYLHGRNCKVILDDDQFFYYKGRCFVNEWASDENFSRIVIDYDLYPFKKERFNSSESWKWDPFSFTTGIIRNYGGGAKWVHGDINTPGYLIEHEDIHVNGTYELTVPGSRETIIPEIIVRSGGNLTVTYEGSTYNLNVGSNKIYDISIKQQNRVLTFNGTGDISVNHQGGWL